MPRYRKLHIQTTQSLDVNDMPDDAPKCYWRLREGLPIPKQIFIYALVDPRTQQRRYIGKTNNPYHRLSLHLSAARSGNTTPKCQWLRELLNLNLRPDLIVLETVPYKDYVRVERKWITHAREVGWPLTNVSSGGGGP